MIYTVANVDEVKDKSIGFLADTIEGLKIEWTCDELAERWLYTDGSYIGTTEVPDDN